MTPVRTPPARGARVVALFIVVWLALALSLLGGVGIVKAWGHSPVAGVVTAFVALPLLVGLPWLFVWAVWVTMREKG